MLILNFRENIMERLEYYDQLVKNLVLYGAGALFTLGNVISYFWIEA